MEVKSSKNQHKSISFSYEIYSDINPFKINFSSKIGEGYGKK